MIEGVVVAPRRVIPDARGKVMHVLKATDPEFEQFGECYCSLIHPGVVKGWHLHRAMVVHCAVPMGRVRLVLFDPRERSATKGQLQEVSLGEDHHALVKVPAGVWQGFQALGASPALVVNVATIPHDPNEIERRDPHDGFIDYDWSVRDR